MVDRRDFLKASALIGAGVGAAGCAGRGEGLLVVPGEALTVESMEAYLGRLDRSMQAIATIESPVPKLFPQSKFDMSDPTIHKGEDLLRKNLRSLMLVGSFQDLPEDGRAYPGMQNRIWASLGEMDEAMLGMHNAVKDLTPTDRAEIGRALREDPELGMRIIAAIDEEAGKFGVSMERRLHLRTTALQACARLKQSAPLFIDEYVTKTEKIMARSTDPEEMQRRLVATLGEQEFFAFRDRHIQYVERWNVASADADPMDSDGSWLKPKRQRRGETAMKVGGILLGIGVVVLGIFILAVTVGGAGIPGMFGITAGALMSVGGLITLIVGAAIKSRSS